MDDLPLVAADELPIHVSDDLPHWRAVLIARGYVNVRVCLAVFKPPEDGLRIFFRAHRRTIGREKWRRLDAMDATRGKLRR